MKKIILLVFVVGLIILPIHKPKTKESIGSQKPRIAITFDDGPGEYTDKIIDTLNKYDAKATFFVLGVNVEGKEEIIKKMAESNHQIGNHTFGHKNLLKLSEKEAKEEIEKNQRLIKSITGKEPQILRPTYGTLSKKLRDESDMPLIMWSVDTLDWKHQNSKEIFKNATKNLKDGDIILFHDIYKSTLDAIEELVPYLINEGYELITIEELFKDKPLKKGTAYFSLYSST